MNESRLMYCRSNKKVKVENRKLWRKWDKKDAQGQQKRGICEDFREIIYR